MAAIDSSITKLFNYIVDFKADDPNSVTTLKLGDFDKDLVVTMQPFFELNTSHGKTLARSQIIDGEEVFERMSMKATTITIRGTVLIDKWKAEGVSLFRQVQDIDSRVEDMLRALNLLHRHVFKANEVISVENVYLNKLGIEYMLVESMTTNPLVGSVGFEFTLTGYDATASKSYISESLIINNNE